MSLKESLTPYGRLFVGAKEALFAKAANLAQERLKQTPSPVFSWALTGGSTPLEWYRWAVASQALSTELRQRVHFTVSDERFVPLTDKQSNFGNANELLFCPLNIPAAQRHPWPTHLPQSEAAGDYARAWAKISGRGNVYDICFLGMGDDAHTASWFPGSPLILNEVSEHFTGLDVPGKGFRLTITPAGLRQCGLVVVMTLGANKAPALKRVLNGPYTPVENPSQILKTLADKVVWLVDDDAASQLS